MSSIYCLKCHKMIWDKHTGFTKGSKEIHLKDQWISICGNCKHKTKHEYLGDQNELCYMSKRY